MQGEIGETINQASELCGPPEIPASLFEVEPDPTLQAFESASQALLNDGYTWNDEVTLRHDLARYKREHPDVGSSPNYIRALYNLYTMHRTLFEQKEMNGGIGYELAKDLAQTNILDPFQYMKEIGEKIFTDAKQYYLTKQDSSDDTLVRLKHLRYGIWRIAREFSEFGLDPQGRMLREATDCIFTILPRSQGGLRLEFRDYPSGGDDKDDLILLFQVEQLFGTVVGERYRSIYDETMQAEKPNFFRAFDLLDVMYTLGHASIDDAQAFFGRLEAEGFQYISSLAHEWSKVHGHAFAKEIGERLEHLED